MNLDELRNDIDAIDEQIQSLFEKRMDIVQGIAEYKKTNHLPVFQTGREEQIMEKIEHNSREEYVNGVKVLFTNLMDISKCLQQNRVLEKTPLLEDILKKLEQPFSLPQKPVIACQGVEGAYSHIAAGKLFEDCSPLFFENFEQVFTAVEEGRVDFGILPIENSNAGGVFQVYDLMKRADFYINYEIKLKIEHCLAAKEEMDMEQLSKIISHEQAIAQSSDFLRTLKEVKIESFLNTALAAKFVSTSNEPIAAICSEKSAELYGLKILKHNIQNNDENYTRFILISKNLMPQDDAKSMTVSLSIPNTTGSLYRLLTKFAVNNVNMTKIESKPMGNKNFDVIFYINFSGSLKQKNVIDLLNDLSSDLDYFNFLGNYKEIN
ncbi:MAG: pheA [Oscillospiraceae bacterium]|nr:pheA [Oscillospiraceae bacterium]